MPLLEMTARPQAGHTVVRLRGDLDLSSSQDLRTYLDSTRREHGERLVLDLAGLEFMDSGGLSVIVSCFKAVTAAGGSLTLAAPRPLIRRTLVVTGLYRRIPLADTLEDAIRRPA
ncbi:anti-sigma factor antagonist [Actinomadura sp. GC306]|uniref:STAS domain-containing protein n=1 Tax=Actinomadura sp. GC306 TaxID=2530367 RepID=UPI00104426AD|nr:STAS domain-containing protein [Actinomadura sp. GC306]TDC71286.1 anti-sigma factor antagonist [Actinomadura sp. GC306]